MTKKELAKAIAQKTEVSTKVAEVFLDNTVEAIMEAALNDEKIFIRGFATIELRTMKQKTGRNITTGETVIIPQRKTVKLKLCREFIETLNS